MSLQVSTEQLTTPQNPTTPQNCKTLIGVSRATCWIKTNLPINCFRSIDWPSFNSTHAKGACLAPTQGLKSIQQAMNLAKAQDGMGKPWWDFYLDQEVVSNVAKREPPEMTHNIRWLEKFIPDFWTDGKKSSNLRNPKNCGIEDSSDSRKFESAGNSRGHEKKQPKHYIF